MKLDYKPFQILDFWQVVIIGVNGMINKSMAILVYFHMKLVKMKLKIVKTLLPTT